MPASPWLRYVPNACSAAIVALVAANYFSPFGDLDYTWQIRTGEIIVRTGNLQPPDQFTYTIAGRDLPDYEWLYEVILWLVWDNLGYGGLKLLRTLMVSATLLLVAWRLRVAGVRWHGVAFALTLATLALAPAWNLRPMFCTSIGLLLISGWLHDHCTGRKRLTWWLPVVMLVWANCHPAVIVGQALLIAAISWEWLNRFANINSKVDISALKRLTLIGGVAVLATFMSPDPIGRFAYPFKPELAHPIHRAFAEMQPLYATVSKAPYTSGLIYVVAALVAASIVLRFRSYRLWEVMFLAGLAFVGNKAARAAQDWMLLMLALGWPHVVAIFRESALENRRRGLTALAIRGDSLWKRLWIGPLLRFQYGCIAVAAGSLLFVSVVPTFSKQMPVQDAPEWPVGATAYLREHGIRGHFFGPSDYGAYVTWQLGDSARCYTDTRGFFYPPVLLEDSHYVPQLGPQWRERLDRILNDYHTDYFMLETTGPRGEMWRQLQGVIGQDVIYLDRQTVVLSSATVRRAVLETRLADLHR